jgi:Fe-S cluster assembly iron-binding protein IscA
MLTVTDTAQELLQTIECPPKMVLKLEPVGTGELGLVSGAGKETDQVIERNGADVLHVPSEVSTALDGAVIDAVETADGPRLSLTPPK